MEVDPELAEPTSATPAPVSVFLSFLSLYGITIYCCVRVGQKGRHSTTESSHWYVSEVSSVGGRRIRLYSPQETEIFFGPTITIF